MKKWKAFDASSWSALLSSLVRVKSTADTNTSAVDQLGEDFAKMAALTSQELAGKQDRASPVSCTIPISGWTEDEAGGVQYHYCYDISVKGVTAADRAEVTVLPGSYDAAVDCGLCPANETLDPPDGSTVGKIRIRAASIPTKEIEVEYWVENGKE